MRRRRLFTFCSACSLLLCVAAGAVWVWSYWYFLNVTWTRGVEPATRDGWFRIEQLWGRARDGQWSAEWAEEDWHGDVFGLDGWVRPDGVEPGWAGLWTFRLFRFQNTESSGYRVIAPIWVIVVLAAICPALHLRAARRRLRRRAAGQCPACGYDLRATPERCPECGSQREGAKDAKGELVHE